ncbi:MAG TPA: hypothetical protein VG841_09240 [Caulobacterales bacterium]|nr:hypothetical protein [Caulobacterales bacterium]
MTTMMVVALAVGAALVFALAIYAWRRFYVCRTDGTYMTHDEHGFKRALKGKGIMWDWEEAIVRGPSAPKIEVAGLDLATGQRKIISLIDEKTGWVNLRPQYCMALPFVANTADDHRLVIQARIQFSLNRDLLKYVYQMEGFGLALETRIQSAFRAEVGARNDEVLRRSLDEVESGAIERLRKAERDGDELGEAGMALGVNFHSANFTYTVEDEVGAIGVAPFQTIAANSNGAAVSVLEGGPRQATRAASGVLSMRPQQLDLLGDVFKGRDAAGTAAILSILEMQTRQNIAEALAGSGQLVVVTGQEVGLAGAAAQREAIARAIARDAPQQPAAPNGATARA